ncbi:MAG: HAMP domain-containing sensor histidine kinase [Clostridiaceae bacterium]|nr:HAMP domain-containing sensor histidine kinase [Clostridiaceae bacterium]
MKKKIISIVSFFCICITCIYIGESYVNKEKLESKKRDIIVELNEIQILFENEEITKEEMNIRIRDVQENLRKIDIKEDNSLREIYIFSLIFMVIIFSYIYFRIIRPFEKLEDFSLEISKGNFDSPLYIERENIFGEFTWAFDIMRNEIKYLRESEQRAIENNKTVIATISHDIKTPIASIRAYAEGLKENMDKSYERKQRYLSVIMRKCDEVTKLTNDLFLHSLSDLEKLKIQTEEYESEEIINEVIKNISSIKCKIQINGEIPKCNISVDKKRLMQVFENIINNSLKYAYKDIIDINFDREEQYLICIIDDYGPGINDEDIPFIFDKFYRGKGVKDKPGAGLGLYIVKYIMNKMNGYVELSNRIDGLRVILKIKIS